MDDFTGTVCGNNVKYPLIGAMREELRGVSRGKDAKDVDWEKVAASFDDLPEKPEPIAIDVSELLSKVQKSDKKPKSGNKKVKAGSATIETKSELKFVLKSFFLPEISPQNAHHKSSAISQAGQPNVPVLESLSRKTSTPSCAHTSCMPSQHSKTTS